MRCHTRLWAFDFALAAICTHLTTVNCDAQQVAPIGRFVTRSVPFKSRLDLAPDKQTSAEAAFFVDNTRLVRLKFDDWNLPRGTSIRITATGDGKTFTMDAEAIKTWYGHTPLLNGPGVLLAIERSSTSGPAAAVSVEGMVLVSFPELAGAIGGGAPNAQPGGAGAGAHGPDGDGAAVPAGGSTSEPNGPRGGGMQPTGGTGSGGGICGSDDRLRLPATGPTARQWQHVSFDLTHQHVYGYLCTASLVLSGEHMVSAGHCAIGGFSSGDLVEFDPPDSDSSGARVAADSNQFSIDVSAVAQQNTWVLETCPDGSSGCITALGEDGLIYRIRRQGGLVAGSVRGTYQPVWRVNRSYSPEGQFDEVAKRGCGVTYRNDPSTNLTMKYLAGISWGGNVHLSTLDGGEYWTFSADSTGGDSGGPLLFRNQNSGAGIAIGVCSYVSHESDSCNGGYYSFTDNDFFQLIQGRLGADGARYFLSHEERRPIAIGGGIAFFSDGSLFAPWPDLTVALANLPVGARLVAAPGIYQLPTDISTISRPMTIAAPIGPVTLSR